MAGHSKWANVKHRKSRVDAVKGKIFTKLAREIIVATREGGGDINSNFRLRLVVQKARENNMPNDNIQRAIQKGTGGSDGENYEQVIYE
ncbi:MAG: YebC/PmpR family DNA-binding transcriptional regulator, partial [Dethiobacter sp.]|nr:YebC/PmpR family DNA-binding transcriptional regulator [Dethiobacter sp.]